MYNWVSSAYCWREIPRSETIKLIGECHTPFTRYSRLSNRLYNLFDTGCIVYKTSNRLSNRLSNRFGNHVERRATVRSTGCQTGLYNRFTTTGWTTGWQQVVSCKRGFSGQSDHSSRVGTTRSIKRRKFSTSSVILRLHDTAGCQIGCQTGLTTG